MKKIFSYFSVLAFAVILAGCENESPDKLIGYSLVSPSDSARTSASAAAFSVQFIKNFSGQLAGQSASAVSLSTTGSDFSVSGPDSQGFYTVKTSGIELQARYRDSGGNKIVGTSSDPTENLMEAVDKAENSSTGAKYYDLKGSFSDEQHAVEEFFVGFNSASFDLTFKIDTIGTLDMSQGSTVSGTISGSVPDGYCTTTLSDIVFDGTINGGSLKVVFEDSVDVYTVTASFNADGSADGIITSKTGYQATLRIESDGTTTYTEPDGTIYELA